MRLEAGQDLEGSFGLAPPRFAENREHHLLEADRELWEIYYQSLDDRAELPRHSTFHLQAGLNILRSIAHNLPSEVHSSSLASDQSPFILYSQKQFRSPRSYRSYSLSVHITA